ncbi:MAG: InlB B-repeat-containing protein [Erysipelotrichaceae bacterium]|nr:InlB B-repeat-containing protein [Erysipelotrichaceae bacterium]
MKKAEPAAADQKSASDDDEPSETWPHIRIAEGNCGVDWAVDPYGIMYFKAGKAYYNGYFELPSRNWVNEIRVVPTEEYSKLILPMDPMRMFSDFMNLKKVDTAAFDTSRVETMYGMFCNDESLESIDLSGFDTSRLLDTGRMFKNCTSLKEVNFSGFDTTHIESVYALFQNCTSLKTVDVTGFKTSKFYDMDMMFCGCTSLESIDLSGFDTARAGRRPIEWMLTGCDSLQKIKFSKSFFEGNMSLCNPYHLETLWVHPSHPDIEKTWLELDDGFTDEDEGWWTISVRDLSFDTRGGAEIPDHRVLTGSSVKLSAFLPEKPGHTFTGWYMDPECTIKADDPLILNENTRIYAGWQVQKRTVSFDSNGGSEFDPLTLDYGSQIELDIYKPLKENYAFDGWYLDPECTVKAENPFVFRENVTLYAGWKDQICTLSFVTNGGTEIDSIAADYGTRIDLSRYIPFKEAYVLTGWYLDPECTIKADAPFILKDHTILYAGWKDQECTLTFETWSGSDIDPVTVLYNQTIDLRNYKPTKKGALFIGWYLDYELLRPAEDQITLKSDTIVYARWKSKLAEETGSRNGITAN